MSTVRASPIPPGPAEPFSPKQDLLSWIQRNFERYGDIYKASVYGSNVYVINAPQYVEHVLLKNWENYPRAGSAIKRIALSLGSGLMSSNGPLWVRQRRMIQPAFTREAVGALYGTFLKCNRELRDKWKQAAREGTSVNVTQDLSDTVLEVMLLVIFGDDYAKVASRFQIVGEEFRNIQFAQTCSALLKIIMEIATERRKQGRDATDFLGIMMRALDRDRRPMPDIQIAREALTLVIAGHETTASVLNWIWYLLSRNPEVEAKMIREVRGLLGNSEPAFEKLGEFSYTKRVIEEALRIYPPGWLMTRRAVNADQLGAYLVPGGTEIYVSPYLLQRHPRLWQEPDRFDPDRPHPDDSQDQARLAMCPFGAGPRNCIGEFFARVEMQLHLLLIARELRLRYEDPRPAEAVAGVNLLSRWHFIMQPQLHGSHVAEASDTALRAN
jgi:cytochrome P450